MNYDQIYQKAFKDELEKLGFISLKPSTIRRAVSFSKKMKQRFEEKYDSKKKKKKRKRKKRFSFVFFRK